MDILTAEEQRRRKLEDLLEKRSKLFGRSDEVNEISETPVVTSQPKSATKSADDKADVKPIIDRQTSLLDQHAHLKKKADQLLESERESERERIKREEREMLETVQAEKALMAASELAKGVHYSEALRTGWRPSREVRHRKESENDSLRKKYEIIVEGDNIPPPCVTFEDMKFPRAIMKELQRRDISKPNHFQMQAIPVLLSGRDMIGIASTGSGKTLVFTLPLIMFCMEQQSALPFMENEGPFGLILCPSRDLAEQTFKDITAFKNSIEEYSRVRLNVCLCIGGISTLDQRRSMSRGCHIMVATPGRLIANLRSRLFNLDICRYLCLDEADRMLDNFEEDLRKVFTYFNHQRQTVFFSATMPRKIHNFALSAMVKPVTVNVSGRAGAVNKKIKQDIEYVKQDAKLYHLLNAIDKTGPPVIIFAKRPSDVDAIHEYLLLKGLQVSAIHGQKDQKDRSQAVDDFRTKVSDILVATDVASKGLDFSDIRHVINYDMPEAIEDYTHRIGRTARRGRSGLATTFVNKLDDESTLLDLKALLIEAEQNVPMFLRLMQSEAELLLGLSDNEKGCAFCGGLGHRIGNCPKLEANQAKQTQIIKKKDVLSGSGDW